MFLMGLISRLYFNKHCIGHFLDHHKSNSRVVKQVKRLLILVDLATEASILDRSHGGRCVEGYGCGFLSTNFYQTEIFCKQAMVGISKNVAVHGYRWNQLSTCINI
jgi:hypothetical protein